MPPFDPLSPRTNMSVAAFAAAIRDQFAACLSSDFAAGEGFTKFQMWQTPSAAAGGAGMYFGDTTTPYWCTRIDAAGDLHFDRFASGAWAADALKFERATATATFSGGIRERGRSTPIGDWTTFAPSLTPSSGTFTGYSTATAKYMLLGSSMWLMLTVTGGVLSTNAAHIDLTIPGGFSSAVTGYATTNIRNGSSYQFGSAYVVAGTTVMGFTVGAEGTGTWTAGSSTDITVLFPFEVW